MSNEKPEAGAGDVENGRKIITPFDARMLQAAESLKPPSHRSNGRGSIVALTQRAAARNVKAGLADPSTRERRVYPAKPGLKDLGGIGGGVDHKDASETGEIVTGYGADAANTGTATANAKTGGETTESDSTSRFAFNCVKPPPAPITTTDPKSPTAITTTPAELTPTKTPTPTHNAKPTSTSTPTLLTKSHSHSHSQYQAQLSNSARLSMGSPTTLFTNTNGNGSPTSLKNPQTTTTRVTSTGSDGNGIITSGKRVVSNPLGEGAGNKRVVSDGGRGGKEAGGKEKEKEKRKSDGFRG